jgi:hypothetical protein
MPSVSCPVCGEYVIVPDGSAGIRCPHCQEYNPAPELAQEAARDSTGTPRPARRDRRGRPTRRRKSNTLLLVGMAVAIVFLVCGGGITLFWFVYIHEIEEPVTDADKEVMITAGYVAALTDDIVVDPNKDKFRKVRHLNRTREMTYEYGDVEDADQPLYVSHTICVERNAKEARDAFAGLNFATRLGIGKADGVDEVDRNDLWSWGDRSRCVIFQSGGQPFGNMFMGLKGRRYFVIVISGVYFNKAEDIKDFLDPFLKKLDGYDG